MNDRMLKIFLTSVLKSLSIKIHAILILDRDDRVVIQAFNPNIQDFQIDEIEKLISSNLTKISSEFDGENVGTFTFSTGKYRFAFSEAGSEAILVFIVPAAIDLTLIFSYIFLCAEKITRINLGKITSFVLPMLEDQKGGSTSLPETQRVLIEAGSFMMKVILAGDSAVGKTTLVEQFISEKFKQDYKSTIGVNLMRKTMHFKNWGIEVVLSVFDMGGQDQFTTYRKVYYQGARAGFIVYDVTRKETFNQVEKWLNEIRQVEPSCMLLLIGNKIDLKEQRQVSKLEGKTLGKKLGLKYLETSALDKNFVEEAFRTLGFLYIIKNRTVQLKK